MQETWTCRDYRKGDEHKILKLYEEVNQRQMTMAHWQWKFARNPFGPPMAKLMFDGANLIGYYAVLPMYVQVSGEPVKAALSVNTMTHPAYEKKGIFTRLAGELYSKCHQEGFKFVYGFPNENSHHGFITKLGWKSLGKMSSLMKVLVSRTTSGQKETHDITPVSRFDSRVDPLWNRIKGDFNVIVPRKQEYLNWRFSDHPNVKYAKAILPSDTDEITGYIVLKNYTSDGETRGHIVDMLCISSKDTIRSLLGYAQDYFIERGICDLSCWAGEATLYGQVLREAGFARRDFGVYFGARVLDDTDKSLRSVESIDNWHLAMSDLDVF